MIMNLKYKGNQMIIEGIECDDRTIEITGINKGDLYMAKRNTGWKLLTCERLSDDGSFVVPVELAYCFDVWECYKVIINI